MVSLFILKELEEKLVSKAKLSPSEAGDILHAVKADAEINETSPLAAMRMMIGFWSWRWLQKLMPL